MPQSVSLSFVFICNWEEGKPIQDTGENIPTPSLKGQILHYFPCFPYQAPNAPILALAASKLSTRSSCVFRGRNKQESTETAAQQFLTQLQSAHAQSVGSYYLHPQGLAQTQGNLAGNLPRSCGYNLLSFKKQSWHRLFFNSTSIFPTAILKPMKGHQPQSQQALQTD